MTDMNANPPPRLSGRIRPWHIVLIVLGGVAALGLALYFILSRALGPMIDTGDRFMTALKAGDFAGAHALATPALQREVGEARQWGATIGNYQPAGWSWSQRSVRNGVGRLEGSVTYRSGNEGRARLQLEQVDGQWRVGAYSLD
jgi:hypothetical protein